MTATGMKRWSEMGSHSMMVHEPPSGPAPDQVRLQVAESPHSEPEYHLKLFNLSTVPKKCSTFLRDLMSWVNVRSNPGTCMAES